MWNIHMLIHWHFLISTTFKNVFTLFANTLLGVVTDFQWSMHIVFNAIFPYTHDGMFRWIIGYSLALAFNIGTKKCFTMSCESQVSLWTHECMYTITPNPFYNEINWYHSMSYNLRVAKEIRHLTEMVTRAMSRVPSLLLVLWGYQYT